MERRFDLRLEELLEGAVLDPRIPEGMLDRMEQFVEPFAASLANGPQRQHVWEYMAGLFSDVKRIGEAASKRLEWQVAHESLGVFHP